MDKIGIDTLRRAVQLFNGQVEDFNALFTLEQLLVIFRAYEKAESVYGYAPEPDTWTNKQLEAVLAGKDLDFEPK